MPRRLISLLLSLTFLLFIATPTIIVMIDDAVDVSSFYASGEEEEKGCEKTMDTDILFLENTIDEASFVLNKVENNLEYCFKTYTKPHLNLISPPPQYT